MIIDAKEFASTVKILKNFYKGDKGNQLISIDPLGESVILSASRDDIATDQIVKMERIVPAMIESPEDATPFTMEAQDADKILTKLAKFGGDVALTLLDVQVEISHAKATFRLDSTTEALTLFEQAEYKDHGAIRDLGECVARASLYMSGDNTRPSLTCLNLEQHIDGAINLVATDGHRLVKLVADRQPLRDFNHKNILIPGCAVQAIALTKGNEASIATSETTAKNGDKSIQYARVTLADNWIVTFSPETATFVDWRQVVPASYDASTFFDRKALLAAVDMAKTCAGRTKHVVLLVGGDNTLEISAIDGKSQAKALCSYKGDSQAFKFGMNHKYLEEALKKTFKDSKEVSMIGWDTRSPVIFRSPIENDNIVVLMPMRL